MKSLLALVLLSAAPVLAEQPPRVVALGGAVTEIVFALGAQDSLVGVDDSSTFPPAAQALERVGYYRAIGAEGVLSLRPTLVLASVEAGPPPAIAQLRKAGVRVEILPAALTPAAAIARIRAIAGALSKVAEGEKLVAGMEATLAGLKAESSPRVLVLFGHGRGSLQAAGQGTAGQAMVELVGATNATAAHHGYKPLTAESVLLARPDVVLTTVGAVRSAGGEAALWSIPGLSATPAGKNKRLLVLDDLYLFGFGPRLGDAAQELSAAIR